MTAFQPNVDTQVIGGVSTATSLWNNIGILLPRTYFKSVSTSRNTTTTYTDDPELLSIPLEVGTFEIELSGLFTNTTTATQKIKTQWKFSGTWNSPIRACMGPGSANTGGPAAVVDMTLSSYTSDTQDAVYATTTAGSYTVFRELVLNAVVTVAGNLSLQWAQSVSSANNTNLQLGTGFRIRRLTV